MQERALRINAVVDESRMLPEEILVSRADSQIRALELKIAESNRNRQQLPVAMDGDDKARFDVGDSRRSRLID